MDFRPRAHIHLVRDRCSNVQAWQKALKEVQGRPETVASHPHANLGFILGCYACISVTDSGIERHFSKASQRITANPRSMLGPTESRRMTALVVDKEMLSGMIGKVKEVWMMYFPPARQ
eukprot:11096063-Heterocapsa_arctica.AAC.1